MAITVTGEKYTGTSTSVGTITLTDTGATFVAADFLEDNQRIIALYDSSTVYKGMAWVDQQTSGTVLSLLDVFRDIDGNEVTQVSGDNYRVSKNFADVSSVSKSVTDNSIILTDILIFGDGTADGVCFYDQNKNVHFDTASTSFKIEILGGLVVFGRVIDWAREETTSGVSINVRAGEGLKINDPDSKFVFAGSNFINTGHDACRFGGFSGQAGVFFVAMNSSSNTNIASPSAGAAWSINPADHRIINMNYWGTGTAGNGSGVGVRWGDGVLKGGTYGFGVSNNSISMFGGAENVDLEIGAGSNSRMSVNNLFQADAKTALFRRNSGTGEINVDFVNVLCDNRRAGTGNDPGSNADADTNLFFKFIGLFTGLVEDSEVYVWRDDDDVSVDSITITSSGLYEPSVLQTDITGHTVNNTYTDWRFVALKYGLSISSTAIAVTTQSVGRGTSDNVDFGGPISQAVDALSVASEATAAAYTTLDDALELYDRAIILWIANYAGESASYVSRSGSQIVLVAVDLVINSAAGSVIAFATSTLTIKSSTFTGGATATTGTVTTENGTLLNGGTFDCDIVYDSGVSTTLTNVTCTGAIDFTTAGTYTLVGCTINEVTNSSGGAVTLNADGDTVITTNTGPSISIVAPPVTYQVLLENIIDGSVYQFKNITTDTELTFDTVSGGTGIDETYTKGVDYSAGDAGRLRISQQSTVTAKLEIDIEFIFSAGDTINALPITQDDNEVYNDFGLDGSTVTEFSWDDPNLEIDVNDADNSTVIQRVGAWYSYYITTNDGIENLIGCLVWESLNSIRAITAMCNLTIDNTKAAALFLNGGRLYRDDNTTIIAATSNSIQVDYSPVYIVETGVSGLTPTESTQLGLIAVVDTNVDSVQANQVVINDGVKSSSLLIPHTTDLPS